MMDKMQIILMETSNKEKLKYYFDLFIILLELKSKKNQK